MHTYLEAPAAFVNWLDGAAECAPTAEQVEHAMFALAARAASRGMTDEHWLFVVDGLIAHAKRRCPQNEALPNFVARGIGFSSRWPSIQEGSERLN
ncbi:MAG TPA: hypothetical protein VLF18_16565 [Tahibacter sp.]|uniref:hypothetical protein n=1 Tax=Tahibacter sp. TaxID=2056211 RepID=UPI002C2FB1FC|nr:hypothetical protein [Tahibacter sp.]HSX61806.1 hypothetical protein [Tahibacter sp.]